MRSNINNTRANGFTLVEILASLMLIGLIIPSVMKGFSMISILASDSQREYQAMDLAETKLAEILLDGDTGSGSGKFEEDDDNYFSWKVESSEWTVSDVKEVTVTVLWTQRNREREMKLSTLVYEQE